MSLPARGTKNGMAVHLAAKTSGWRQSPIAPMVESATTAALYNTLRIQPRQIHIPFDMTLLVQGVVFFRLISFPSSFAIMFSVSVSSHPPSGPRLIFLDDRLELTLVQPNSTAFLTAIERITLERVSL